MQQLKQDYEADPSFALSPDFSELDPKLQMQMDELVQDSVPPDMIAFVFALLDHVRLESHRIFLNTCSVWLNR
jgi:ABC-type thiamine transport system ATPase subunit